MKVAIVHDWLTNMGGAEQCIINLHKCYPEAPISTTFYTPDNMDPIFKEMNIKTSFLQRKKDKKYNHKKYLPLMPKAFERFDLKDFDIIISSSSSCAKGAKKGSKGIHICYCHTPMRYAWEKQEDYTKNMGCIKRKLVNTYLKYIRKWDVKSSKGVDFFIANSNEVKNRIKEHYNREAVVINPPVRCSMFNISDTDGDYFLVLSRLVSYKRYDLAVKACMELNKKLVVIGEGPEKENLEKIAEGNENIIFLGRQPDDVVAKYMAECKALIFPGEEDFGIVPVEAEACRKTCYCIW